MKNKYTIKSLQQLLTDNSIEHTKTSKHAQLLYEAIDAGILTCEDMFPTKDPKPIDPKYEYGSTCGMYHEILSSVTFPASAPSPLNIASLSDFRTSDKVCFKP